MLIPSQNHTNRVIPKQTTFRGDFDPDNVRLIAQHANADPYSHFMTKSLPKETMSPAQQIYNMRLPGETDFHVEFMLCPTHKSDVSFIRAITTTASCAGEGVGFATHRHGTPKRFGENMVRATNRATNILANTDAYIAHRAKEITHAYAAHGIEISRLGLTSRSLPVGDRHEFLTRLQEAAGTMTGEGKNVYLFSEGRKINVEIGRKIHEIKLPMFGILQSRGRILADELIKLLR